MDATFKYSFDLKCFELAEYFLPAQATSSVKRELAQAIQDTVENFGIPPCEKCKGAGKVSDPYIFGAFVLCPDCH